MLSAAFLLHWSIINVNIIHEHIDAHVFFVAQCQKFIHSRNQAVAFTTIHEEPFPLSLAVDYNSISYDTHSQALSEQHSTHITRHAATSPVLI